MEVQETRSIWASAWSSRRGAGGLALLLLCAAPGAEGVVYHSQKEALALAFPDADRIERRNFVLDDAQAEQVEERAKTKLESKIVTFHVGHKGHEVLGYAIIDVHTVRTLPEALMIVLTPQGVVRSVRVLAFHEPTEFQPTQRWYRQFDGRTLKDPLQIKRGVHAVAGATLSSHAATRSVRRTLALYELLLAKAVD